jgi:hypothetical protein
LHMGSVFSFLFLSVFVFDTRASLLCIASSVACLSFRMYLISSGEILRNVAVLLLLLVNPPCKFLIWRSLGYHGVRLHGRNIAKWEQHVTHIHFSGRLRVKRQRIFPFLSGTRYIFTRHEAACRSWS